MKGLRIVVTPWRSPKELLQVREWLYPEKQPSQIDIFSVLSADDRYKSEVDWNMKRKACDQISAWKLRPPLPHAVESTWLLTEAILADQRPQSSHNISTFSLKAGYVTAITRFVTALLDSSQTSKFKVSMYTKAAELRLPAMFVDLRHEATHGEMPSLVVLRDAAAKALEWLWEDFWVKMGGKGGSDEMSNDAGSVDVEDAGVETEDSEGDAEETEPWETCKRWRPRPIGVV